MNLEQKITSFLATADTQPPQSKLEPYTELIRSLRQKRWPFHRIAKALQDDFGRILKANGAFRLLKVIPIADGKNAYVFIRGEVPAGTVPPAG